MAATATVGAGATSTTHAQPVCPRFSQNAWRRELCANCFKSKAEHRAPAPRPAPVLRVGAPPPQSILKGKSDRRKRAPGASVCFPTQETEIIGYDGGDVDSDDDGNDPSEDVPDTSSSSSAVIERCSVPELTDAEDKQLQSLTQRNTDFNSINANLLKDTKPSTVPLAPVKSSGVTQKSSTGPLELGRKAPGTPPIVCVQPFGVKSSVVTPSNVCRPTDRKAADVIQVQVQAAKPELAVTKPDPVQVIRNKPEAVVVVAKSKPEVKNNTDVFSTKIESSDIVYNKSSNNNNNNNSKSQQEETVVSSSNNKLDSPDVSKSKTEKIFRTKSESPVLAVDHDVKSKTETCVNIVNHAVTKNKPVEPEKIIKKPDSLNENLRNKSERKPHVEESPSVRNKIVETCIKTELKSSEISIDKHEIVNHVETEIFKSNVSRQGRSHSERRPPLGHEDTSAPLTAPALVQMAKDASPPPQETPPSFPSLEDEEDPSDDRPPLFSRHKDSVQLSSPPRSPRLRQAAEERPAPIGKVSSSLTVTLRSTAALPETKRAPRLVEARSSALIRRWTVGERVSLQPRRPVLDAPEIVPLALQSGKSASSMGLESREMAGQPDGEDSSTAGEPQQNTSHLHSHLPKDTSTPTEKHLFRHRSEEILSYRQPIMDKPPTPPSSPLPDEEAPPTLPVSPPPVLETFNLHCSYASMESIALKSSTPAPPKATVPRPTSLLSTPRVTAASGSPRTATISTSSPRSSFLHGGMLGRPQIPAKPASLLLGASANRRIPPPVSTPVTPQKVEILPPVCSTPEKSEEESLPSLQTLATPQEPSTPLQEPPSTPSIQENTPADQKQPFATPKPKSGSVKKRRAPKPPGPSPGQIPPSHHVQPSPQIPPSPQMTQPPQVNARPLMATPSSPQSLKNSQSETEIYSETATPKDAPLMDIERSEKSLRTRSPSEDSFEDTGRRDSLEKSPPSKKSAARFSLRRLLRLGKEGKEERAVSPESSPSPTSPPASPPSSPSRPEIIHPGALDGREVEVVCRVSPTSSPTLESPPPLQVPGSPTTTTGSTPLPAARPRPPLPPPRTLSLSASPVASRPLRPPPPQSAELLELRQQASSCADQSQNEHAVYANLDSMNRRTKAPSKPQRTGSMSEACTDEVRRPSADVPSPNPEDGDYEMVHFADGRMSRRRRSTAMNSLEENYGAVVGANHRALAQLLSSLSLAQSPSSNHCKEISLETYAREGKGEEERGLVLLQVLTALQNIGGANLQDFKVASPEDSRLAEGGQRVIHTPASTELQPSTDVAVQVCQLLFPTDLSLPSLLQQGPQGLKDTRDCLEFRLWGPELAPEEPEVALQRWLDLERATALQGLAQGHSNTHRLSISQEMYFNFLIQASAIGLIRASKL